MAARGRGPAVYHLESLNMASHAVDDEDEDDAGDADEGGNYQRGKNLFNKWPPVLGAHAEGWDMRYMATAAPQGNPMSGRFRLDRHCGPEGWAYLHCMVRAGVGRARRRKSTTMDEVQSLLLFSATSELNTQDEA